MSGKIHPFRWIFAMAAAAFDESTALVLSGPNAIANLIEPHIEPIVMHPVAKRASHKAIQEADIVAISKCPGIVPVLFLRRDLRKPVVDGNSQFLGRKPDFEIHD